MRNFSESLVVCVLVIGFCLGNATEAEEALPIGLRSAFLGPEAWPTSRLSDDEIRLQLKQHFDCVLELLETQTESSLIEAVDSFALNAGPMTCIEKATIENQLRKQRTRNIETLRQYAARELFPVNHGHAEHAVPIFVDDHGTHCAVGYLMHRSGANDVVQEIVQTNNYILVDGLQSTLANNWILQSGLTVREAAMIQPAYAPPEFDALLSDFVDSPGFSVSEFDMAVSGLSVIQYSFLRNGMDQQALIETAKLGLELEGEPFPFPDTFGIAVGQGIHDPGKGKKIFYEPNFDNWVFVGGVNVPLGQANFGDDVIAYRICYDVSIKNFAADEMTLASSGNFNGNFMFGPQDSIYIESMSEIDSGVLGSGVLQGTGEDFILSGTAFFPTGRNQFKVVSYVIDYRPKDFGDTGFTSLWNEFEYVLIGDANCDGEVNLLDVDSFVEALMNDFPDVKADINQDGSDDLLDVVGFVELLAGG